MENSKWVKSVSEEALLELKNRKDFVFSVTNVSKELGVPLKRVGELLKFYNIVCPRLTTNVRITTEEWVSRCKEIHGDTFDYSVSKYINNKTSVKIGCKVHGVIEVNPVRHMNGSGCKRCQSKAHSIFKPVNKGEYIKRLAKKHNGKYDYSLVHDFENVHEKAVLICPHHGKFKQVLHAHSKGSGCVKCSYEYRGNNMAIDFKEFLSRAKDKFGDLYEYVESSYTKISDKVSYVCNIHGVVSQNAVSHLTSSGCAKCFPKNERSNTEDFIEKAVKLHNGFYRYDKVEYGESNRNKVLIECPFHSYFSQTPNSHLNGAGCPICAKIKSNMRFSDVGVTDIEASKNIKCQLYLLKLVSDTMTYYKIGISTEPKRRFDKLSRAHGAKVSIIHTIDSSLFVCSKLEGDVLNSYKKFQKRGTIPYGIEGSTECFNMNLPIQEIINNIQNLLKPAQI